jgi:lupus La protein
LDLATEVWTYFQLLDGLRKSCRSNFLKLMSIEASLAMSDSKVEPTEATTNPTTEEPKNIENGDSKPTTEDDKISFDSKPEDRKDAEEEQQREKKPRHNGPRTYDNGMLKTSASVSLHGNRNSKYDPSVLETTDNPKEIRGQVGCCKHM